MQRFVHVPAGRFLATLACSVLVLALGVPSAVAGNHSIFKSTQAYVGRSTLHQNAFDDKYTARDFSAARTELVAITRNAVAARAVLAGQKPSDARGAKGKQALLQYWKLKQAATAELGLAVEATASGNAAAAKRHIARYDKVADKAVGLLFVSITYLDKP